MAISKDTPRPDGWDTDIWEFYRDLVPGLPDHRPVVEVGTWLGRSLVYLGALIQSLHRKTIVYGVDTFDGGSAPTPEMQATVQRLGGSLYNEVAASLALYGVDDVVRLIKADSVEAAQQFEDGTLGLVFIDTSHQFERTAAEIRAWLPKLAPGGWLAGHDYDQPEVKRAVEQELPGATGARRLVWSYQVPCGS